MIIEGLKVFDPRDGQCKVSDNPALLFADLILNCGKHIITNYENTLEFWKFIADMANFCDAHDYIKEKNK